MPEGKLVQVLAHCKKKGINIKTKKSNHKTENESKEPNNCEMIVEKQKPKNVDHLNEIINVKDKDIG